MHSKSQNNTSFLIVGKMGQGRAAILLLRPCLNLSCSIASMSVSTLPALLPQANALLGGLRSSGQGTSGIPLFRGFTTQKQQPSPRVTIAAEMLQQCTMQKLRNELDLEAERSLHVPYSRFVELAIQSGAASTPSEAEDVCKVLHRAGVVLRHEDLVYLRAEEIADMVTLMLPGGKDAAQERLQKVEAELEALNKVHDQVEARSRRMADVFLTGGLVVLMTQFAAFIYLTWWELSWDVMEPIAYIISLFYSLVAYIYFLCTRDTFDLGPFRDYWATRLKKRKIQELKFDEERWQFLTKLRDRYKRQLSHSQLRI